MKPKTKENVSRFNEDVQKQGNYSYNLGRLSTELAKARILRGLTQLHPMAGKRLLDLGCGDGVYSLALLPFGAKSILGIDPADSAVAQANDSALRAGVADRAKFQVSSVYELQLDERFDSVLFTGVLHHLSDPETAIRLATQWSDTLLITEPNGNSPLLKVIEKLSPYHRQHEEQSFTSSTLMRWCKTAGYTDVEHIHINFVPMLCPDWMARLSKRLEPYVETSFLRHLLCAQILICARKGQAVAKAGDADRGRAGDHFPV
ncbi:class I SAM-dependent methyltransferase [Pseudodesulfovibrio sp.]|uniref:class I SAM-dependent methyltransferase n=1 Tax=Pseudodesulfovibrio sp. TaxID=2035812 RepID=UPI002609A922|nr:class I SAM-dependent methyltransferase [Pseudodesulfovibrio sp.]MDD3311790.1 methyltransferase domain-containing protein [Pseudodesulfovibrio sp.]